MNSSSKDELVKQFRGRIGHSMTTYDVDCIEAALAAAQPEAEPVAQPVADAVNEAFNRLLENGVALGPASAEDAILVSKYRRNLLSAKSSGIREGLLRAAEILKDVLTECLKDTKQRGDHAVIKMCADAITRAAEELPETQVLVRWRKLDDVPVKTGRYAVGHAGGIVGHAYYTAKTGETRYPVGWAQMPDFGPTHWIDPPKRAEAEELPETPADQVMVPVDFVKFLNGELPYPGTDAWFGDDPPPGEKGKFWWRKGLRAAQEGKK